MNIFTKIFLQARDFLFPGACALCGGNLTESVEIHRSLCQDCSPALSLPVSNKCNLCGKPLISEIDTCLPCRNGELRSYERLWVLYPYIGNCRKLLTAYKFQKNLALANIFAEKIMEILTTHVFTEYPELKNAWFVPVPPGPGKIKNTGWDQIDHLVKRLKKTKGCLPVLRCLKRKKSKVQKQLDRAERLENLKGRIYLTNKKIIKDGVFIIIDDVITTGSTLEVCAAALKASGASKVYGICLFFD